MAEVTLSEAIYDVKVLLTDEPCYSPAPSYCLCLYCSARRLVAAIEAHLGVERRHAEILLGLADLQRHGGE